MVWKKYISNVWTNENSNLYCIKFSWFVNGLKEVVSKVLPYICRLNPLVFGIAWGIAVEILLVFSLKPKDWNG